MAGVVSPIAGLQLHAELWKAAYGRLDESLTSSYEAILKAELNIGIDTSLDDQAVLLVQRRRQRVVNRQWTYKFRGQSRKVRDQIDAILDVVQKASTIVSAGMNFAPVVASLPWAGITALLPFITNDSKEHKAALDGLEKVTEIMARYRVVEQIHNEPKSVTFSKLKDALIDLYSMIFEYQARLADYLGGWSDLTQELSSADTICQHWIRLHDSENAQLGARSLVDLMNQGELVNSRLARMDNQRAATKILSWISDHDAFEDHDDKLEVTDGPYLSSGQWLYKTDAYETWSHAYSRVLILRGSVGTGKSTLISIAIEHFLSSSTDLVAFYYCSRSSAAASTTRAIASCLLRQLSLVGDGNTLDAAILEKYERRTQRSWNQLNMPRNNLLDVMVDVLDASSGAIIVVDALDECADPGDLLHFLNELSNRTPKLRFLFSTRPHVTTPTSCFHNDVIQELDIADHTAEDLAQYLICKLGLDSRGDDDVPNLRQATALYSMLKDLASGMFRWVKLQVDLFLEIERARDFDNALDRLAETTLTEGDDKANLYAAYDTMYDTNVGRKPKDLHTTQAEREAIVQRILLWTLCANRPLRLNEMLEAVKLNEDDSIISGIDERYLLMKGSNFIRKDTQQRIVFTHLSVREYLTDSKNIISGERFSFDAASQNRFAASISMQIFFRQEPHQSDWEFLTSSSTSPSKWTFYSYCCSYWVHHYQASTKHDDHELIIRNFSAMFPYFPTTQTCHQRLRSVVKNTHSQAAPKEALFVAAEAVHAMKALLISGESNCVSQTLAFVQYLAACGEPLSVEVDNMEQTPSAPMEGLLREDPVTLLELAVTRSDAMLEMLLYYGARVNCRSSRNHNLLHAAAAEGTVEGMRTILKSPSAAGCFTIAQSDGLTPIEVALVQHNFECADVLWSALLDQNEVPISDSIVKLYTRSLARARAAPGTNRAADRPASTDKSTCLVRGARHHQMLCSWCQALFAKGKMFTTDGQTGGINFAIPDIQDFPRIGVPLGRPLEIASRADSGCRMCKILQKHIPGDLSLTGIPSKFWLLDRSHGPALIVALCFLSYSLLVGISLVLLWGYVSIKYKWRSASQVICRTYCTKMSYRERYMNIWTVETQTHGEDGQVLASQEFEVCQLRDLQISGPSFEPGSHTLAGEGLRSCSLNESTFANGSLAMMRSWLSSCESHARCKSPSSQRLPTFVIDVCTPGVLKLCESLQAEGEAYCAYSGVWGTLQNYVPLRSANIEAYKAKGFDTNLLPSAWRDAAELTRLLGFRYLWVDGLCIVQDHEESWRTEILQIPDYFRQAHIVIASALADSSTSLVRTRSDGIPILKLELDLESPSTICFRTPLQDSATALLQSKWAQRGWTMSERYLANRLLIIGEEQVYWNCNTLLWSEGSTEPQEPLWRLVCSAFTTRSLTSGSGRSAWYSLVEYHTSTTASTTVLSDRLISLASLATALASGDRYWAGLWGDDLYVGLLWRRIVQATYSQGCDVPTWSWGCLEGAVSFHTSVFKRLESSGDAEIVEISLSTYSTGLKTLRFQIAAAKEDESHQYGTITSGYLVLNALSKGSNSAPDGSRIFDQIQDETGRPWSEIPVTTILISQWENMTGTTCQWHGLLLQKVAGPAVDGLERFRRVGVYMSASRKLSHSGRTADHPVGATDVLENWERREFHII